MPLTFYYRLNWIPSGAMDILTILILSIHCCFSVAQSCPTLCDPMDCHTPVSPSFTTSQSLLKFTTIELVMPYGHLILPSIFPSIRVFSNYLALHIRWPKYWSFSFSISPLTEIIFPFICVFNFFDLMSYSFQCTNLLPPCLNLFLSILFFRCTWKWNCFLNFSFW